MTSCENVCSFIQKRIAVSNWDKGMNHCIQNSKPTRQKRAQVSVIGSYAAILLQIILPWGLYSFRLPSKDSKVPQELRQNTGLFRPVISLSTYRFPCMLSSKHWERWHTSLGCMGHLLLAKGNYGKKQTNKDKYMCFLIKSDSWVASWGTEVLA